MDALADLHKWVTGDYLENIIVSGTLLSYGLKKCKIF